MKTELECKCANWARADVNKGGHHPNCEFYHEVSRPSSLHGKWGYSTDEEHFNGDYESEDEAISSALHILDRGRKFWVGQYCTPTPPEDCIDADDIIEQVICQDDYSGDWAEDWPGASQAQLDELTRNIRDVFAKWLNRHALYPAFANIIPENVKEVENA